MPYAWVVASYSVGCLLSNCSLDLAFPSSLAVLSNSFWLIPFVLFVEPVGFPYIPYSLVNPGIVCLASQSSDWLDALWASLSGV